MLIYKIIVFFKFCFILLSLVHIIECPPIPRSKNEELEEQLTWQAKEKVLEKALEKRNALTSLEIKSAIMSKPDTRRTNVLRHSTSPKRCFVCGFKQLAPYLITILILAALIGGGLYAYKIYKNKESQKSNLPEKSHWREVGILKDIYLYPVKSCGVLELNRAECTNLGLRVGEWRDRFFMVVNDKYNFITARAYPELLTVLPSVHPSNPSIITLRQGNETPLHINLAEVVKNKNVKTVHIWDEPVRVLDCGWKASDWFSRVLARRCGDYRLVYYRSQNSRTSRRDVNVKRSIHSLFTKNKAGAFSDEAPFNLLNQASVDDLNKRLDSQNQVTAQNFRPNFVITDVKAYEEDNWKFVKIGDNVFEIVKPCVRCIIVAIDPATGERSMTPEPLETLKSYRQCKHLGLRKSVGNCPILGLQMVLRSPSGRIVSTGDPVYIAYPPCYCLEFKEALQTGQDVESYTSFSRWLVSKLFGKDSGEGTVGQKQGKSGRSIFKYYGSDDEANDHRSDKRSKWSIHKNIGKYDGIDEKGGKGGKDGKGISLKNLVKRNEESAQEDAEYYKGWSMFRKYCENRKRSKDNKGSDGQEEVASGSKENEDTEGQADREYSGWSIFRKYCEDRDT